MPANLENSAVATGLEKVSFHSNPKERKCWRMSNYHTIALSSHASKVMLKIFQARLQQYVNSELPDVQAGFRNGRGTRDQIANICWIIEKSRESQKNIYFCFIDYAKAFDCVDHNTLWKILKEMRIPDHLTCSWETCMQVRKQQLELDMEICPCRDMLGDAGQEATVRTGHGNMSMPGEISITSDMQMTPPLWQ